MRILGIDPGHTGALVLLDMRVTLSEPELAFADMPTARSGTRGRPQVVEALVADIVRNFRPEHAIFEDVHSMRHQGVASTFAFGLSYGVVRGVLAALNIPSTPIEPQKWRKLVALPVGADKDAARARAAQLFPVWADNFRSKKHSGRADAALIALAGFRTISPF
jgi:crossover junction endodeoxyribonuclease RuvC